MNSKGNSRQNQEEKKPLGFVYIPYVKGVSEEFRRIVYRYNIRTIFQTKRILRSSLMKTRLEGEAQLTTQCVYSIPCECSRSYISETGRPLTVRLREHRYSFKEGLLEKSKLAQHAYEENHNVDWDRARILLIERNSKLRKYKESAHMAYAGNSISQPSLDFSLSGFD
jgi:hypothetical protein